MSVLSASLASEEKSTCTFYKLGFQKLISQTTRVSFLIENGTVLPDPLNRDL